MIPLLKPANALPDVLQYYVATELLDDPSAIILSPGGGMPADTVILPAARVILSFTCVASPMFRNKVHDLARDSSIDVILLRCCLTPGDILPITADVTLAGGGLAPSTCMSSASTVTPIASSGWFRRALPALFGSGTAVPNCA